MQHKTFVPAVALCIGAGGLLAAAPLWSAPNSQQRVAAFAKLPNWTGLWQADLGGGGPPPGGGGNAGPGGAAPGGTPIAGPPRAKLPFTPAWQAKIDAYHAELEKYSGAEQVPDNTVTECIWGIPRLFRGPYMFEVTVLPEQTFFNYDVIEYRHIWTDGRAHPKGAALKLTDTGHSIGHWEDGTLVIDTVGIKPLWVDGEGTTLSDQVHIVERWKQLGPDRLQMDATISDPVALTQSYSVTNQYKRITDTNRMLQQNCFENIHEVQEGDKVITRFAPSKG
ncbi:MAG: hypothetical protein QM718_08125 [Steroidobacteraceae bacterium]